MVISSFGEFKRYLDDQSQLLVGKPASTHKVPSYGLDKRARSRAWWMSTGRKDGNSTTSLNRNKAYLRSYLAAKGVRFPAPGISFQNGTFVRPDRSVMERSLRDGHVIFDEQTAEFEITESGLAFIGCTSV